MSKNIDFKRLSLAIHEFWLMNKTKILTIPFVVLVLLTIYYLWYDTPLAKYHLFNMYPNKESFIAELAYYGGLNNRGVILLLLPIYIIVCSQSYLSKLNTSVRTTMIPFTRGERLITLWIYTLLIIGLVLGSFIGIDSLIGQLLKSSYLAQSVQYMESRGDLYHEFTNWSYFGSFDSKFYYIILSFTLVGTSIYHLATLFFKKFSVLKFLLIIILFIVILINVILKIHELNQEVSITAINSTAANWALSLFIAIVVGLTIATTYYKLKEKEI